MLSEHTGRDSPWVGLASLDGVSKTLIGPLKARVQRPQSREYHKHVSCSKDPHYKALLKIIMSFVLSVNINWDKSLVAIQNVQMPRPPRPKYPPRTRSGHKVSAIDTRSRSRPCTQLNAASGPPSPFPRLTRSRRRSWPQDPSHIAAMLIRLVLDFRRGR